MVRVAITAVITVIVWTVPASAEVCSVAIPRAPDNVREEIELWVRAEPRCSVELEVRVVPTDGGYYLFARDQQGRVRERVVPDAQSAGVLVASWVADDSQVRYIDAPPPSIERVPPTLEVAPGAIAPAPRSKRWVTLGGMTQIGDPGAMGIRGEIDLINRGAWTVSTVLAGSGRPLEVYDASSSTWAFGTLKIRDLTATAQVSRTSTFGRWQLRVAGALGVAHTEGDGYIGSDHLAVSGNTATGGLSLMLGRELGKNWAFTAGPVVTVYSQTLTGRFEGLRDGMTTPVERHETQLMAFGGLRHRL